jgi:hypothetical protein
LVILNDVKDLARGAREILVQKRVAGVHRAPATRFLGSGAPDGALRLSQIVAMTRASRVMATVRFCDRG